MVEREVGLGRMGRRGGEEPGGAPGRLDWVDGRRGLRRDADSLLVAGGELRTMGAHEAVEAGEHEGGGV